MGRYVYTVVESTPGYLPDSDPGVHGSRRSADADARQLAAELRAEGYRVWGNPHDGYWAERGSRDLGRVVEVSRWSLSEARKMGLLDDVYGLGSEED